MTNSSYIALNRDFISCNSPNDYKSFTNNIKFITKKYI